MKGAFILRANKGRKKWEIGGPYFPGSAVYALAYDDRAGRHRLWAGPQSMHWGGLLRSSDDFGRSWTNPQEANVKFPESAGAALKRAGAGPVAAVVIGRHLKREWHENERRLRGVTRPFDWGRCAFCADRAH